MLVFGPLVVLILLFGIACPLVLYAAIRSETSGTEVVDRTDAERRVRNDTDVGDRRR